MDSSEFIQLLVQAAMPFAQRILLSMTEEQREKRDQAVLACTQAVYDIDPNEVFCNITIDIICWPPTRAGSTAEIQCFEHQFTDPKNIARRECSVNGTWLKPKYLGCLKALKDDPVLQTTNKRAVSKVWFDYAYPIASVALLIAIAVLFYFKTLRCLRNYIHCNLMLAQLITNTKYLLLSYTEMKIMKESHHGCKVITFIYIYFNSSINYWMFVEGFYLLTLVLWTYRAHMFRLWHFLIFGWGTPLVVTSIYAVLMAIYDTESFCWLPRVQDYKNYKITLYTIIVASTTVLIMINFLIVIYVVWTLCHKLRGNTTIEIQQVRKATRAIIVLLPILGVHVMVTYFLEYISTSHDANLAFYNIRSGLQAMQGIVVALFYCFLNGEVHTAIRQKWAVFLEHRSIKASLSQNLSGKKSGHSGIRSSFDNKDIFPTLYDKTEIAQLSMTPTGMRQTPLAKIESSV